MDKTILMIFVPLWWIIVVTDSLPAMLSLANTDPLTNTITLGLLLIAAWLSELHRTGRLPSLRRGEQATEYAVEFENEEVWDDEND